MLQYKRAATEHDAKATKAQDIKKGGLDALLGSLQQAKKVNVLDKSRMDWGDFKSSDVKVSKSPEEKAAVCLACSLQQNFSIMRLCIANQIANIQANCARDDWQSIALMQVDEELEGYKKSGDKYLDKVDFLKRAELRQYEKERDQRLSQDMRSRGRL